MGFSPRISSGLFQDGMYPQVGNKGEETYLLNRIKPVDFGTWFTEFNKQLLLRETEETNWWLDDVDFIHWLAAGCFAGVKFQALGSNNLNGWGLSSVQFQHKPSQFLWERSREHWTERAAFGFPVCCFPLKNLPFSMTSDPSERRRKVDTRWSLAMAAKLERSRLAAMAFCTKSDQFGCAECCVFFIFFICQWAKSHGIFPAQMTIQVVPSSLEQTEWVHRPQTGCPVAPWPTGGPQAPKSGRSQDGRGAC